MEPNPIYWLELQQLRRSPLPHLLFVAGVVMGVFLFWIGLDENRSHQFWYTPMQWIPLVFHVLTLFGVPFTRATLFVNQQMSEDLTLQTPMKRSTVFLGKLKPGFLLVVLAYLPVLPGVVFFAVQGRWGYPMMFWLTFVASLSLVPVFLGFMAGVKTVGNVIGRIFRLFVFLLFGLMLFWICFGVLTMVMADLWDVEPFTDAVFFLAVFMATAYLLCIGALVTWIGVVLFDPRKRADELIGFLFFSGFALFLVLSGISMVTAGEFSGPIVGGLFFVLVCFFGPLVLLLSTTNAKKFAQKHLFPYS